MYQANWKATIDDPWRSMEPMVIGVKRPLNESATGFVTVEKDGVAFARIDVFVDWQGPFSRVITWKGWVVTGWGEVVHLVDPVSRSILSIPCDGYFGCFYEHDECLLIGSASELICVEKDGRIRWNQSKLGVDGVLVSGIEDEMIHGQGEWDPPGGWRAFCVSLKSGEIISI